MHNVYNNRMLSPQTQQICLVFLHLHPLHPIWLRLWAYLLKFSSFSEPFNTLSERKIELNTAVIGIAVFSIPESAHLYVVTQSALRRGRLDGYTTSEM